MSCVAGWSLNECNSCRLVPYQPLTVFTLGISSNRGGKCPISFIMDANRTGNSFRRKRYDCFASPSRAIQLKSKYYFIEKSIFQKTNRIQQFVSLLNQSADISNNDQSNVLTTDGVDVGFVLNAFFLTILIVKKKLNLNKCLHRQ